MSLEGNLRDLALAEVCQLLAHTRKSGELRLKAPLAGLHACILFESGAIVGAAVNTMPVLAQSPVSPVPPGTAQAIERTTLELLCWNDGEFRFVPRPSETESLRTGVRLHTELLLMEGARRSEEWDRLADRIPNARVVPAFADVEPRQLPLLQLQPQQWEVLTGVDGQRDLAALARSLGRDLLEVAEIVHELIGTGLLKLADVTRVQRTQATPPSSAAAQNVMATDVWVPARHDATSDCATDRDDNDDIFDPVRFGVITPEGLPRLRTPLHIARVTAKRLSATPASVLPSDIAELRERGNAAAERGDFKQALRYWEAILECGDSSDGSNRERANSHKAYANEGIAVVKRLQILLNANRIR